MVWWPGKLRNKFSAEYLAGICNDVIKYTKTPEAVKCEGLIEDIRQMSEILVWGDANDESKIFDTFLERNMLPYLTDLLCSVTVPSELKVQLIQTLYIIVQNLKSPPSIFYILSGDHINKMLLNPTLWDELNGDDELQSNFVNFLKSLSLKLDVHTIQCFYNRDTDKFPLYRAAEKFLTNRDSLVRAASRAIVVHMCQVDDEYVINYVLNTAAYMTTVFRLFKRQQLRFDGCWGGFRESIARYRDAITAGPAKPVEKERAKLDLATPGEIAILAEDILDDCYYFNDLLQTEKPELLHKLYEGTIACCEEISAAISAPPTEAELNPDNLAPAKVEEAVDEDAPVAPPASPGAKDSDLKRVSRRVQLFTVALWMTVLRDPLLSDVVVTTLCGLRPTYTVAVHKPQQQQQQHAPGGLTPAPVEPAERPGEAAASQQQQAEPPAAESHRDCAGPGVAPDGGAAAETEEKRPSGDECPQTDAQSHGEAEAGTEENGGETEEQRPIRDECPQENARSHGEAEAKTEENGGETEEKPPSGDECPQEDARSHGEAEAKTEENSGETSEKLPSGDECPQEDARSHGEAEAKTEENSGETSEKRPSEDECPQADAQSHGEAEAEAEETGGEKSEKCPGEDQDRRPQKGDAEAHGEAEADTAANGGETTGQSPGDSADGKDHDGSAADKGAEGNSNGVSAEQLEAADENVPELSPDNSNGDTSNTADNNNTTANSNSNDNNNTDTIDTKNNVTTANSTSNDNGTSNDNNTDNSNTNNNGANDTSTSCSNNNNTDNNNNNNTSSSINAAEPTPMKSGGEGASPEHSDAGDILDLDQASTGSDAVTPAGYRGDPGAVGSSAQPLGAASTELDPPAAHREDPGAVESSAQPPSGGASTGAGSTSPGGDAGQLQRSDGGWLAASLLWQCVQPEVGQAALAVLLAATVSCQGSAKLLATAGITPCSLPLDAAAPPPPPFVRVFDPQVSNTSFEVPRQVDADGSLPAFLRRNFAGFGSVEPLPTDHESVEDLLKLDQAARHDRIEGDVESLVEDPASVDAAAPGYPYRVVDGVLRWLVHVLTDLKAFGRLESVETAFRGLLFLVGGGGGSGPGFALPCRHAVLFRRVYALAFGRIRERYFSMKAEAARRSHRQSHVAALAGPPPSLLSRGAPPLLAGARAPPVSGVSSPPGSPAAKARAQSVMGTVEEEAGHPMADSAEALAALFDAQLPLYAAVSGASAKALVSHSSVVFPLCSYYEPPPPVPTTPPPPSSSRSPNRRRSGSTSPTPGGGKTPPTHTPPPPAHPPRADGGGSHHVSGPVSGHVRQRSNTAAPVDHSHPPHHAHHVSPSLPPAAEPSAASLASIANAELGRYKIVGTSGAVVRAGAALDSRLISRLSTGDEVEIVEIQQRRCRITHPREGWISLWNTVGVVIVQKVPDDGSKAAPPPGRPAWLAKLPLEKRVAASGVELARVEAVVLLLARRFVHGVTGRTDSLPDAFRHPEDGPFLARVGGVVERAQCPKTVRCQTFSGSRCPPFTAPEFAASSDAVLHLHVAETELLLLQDNGSDETAKIVVVCPLYLTHGEIDGRLNYRLTLRCRNFTTILAFENAPVCQQVATKVNSIARSMRLARAHRILAALADDCL
ncbi:Protein CLEC16A-like protein [Diplonema papillatum]|nr:Protein CLEC16A-like protein [Diplonema papillatum]